MSSNPTQKTDSAAKNSEVIENDDLLSEDSDASDEEIFALPGKEISRRMTEAFSQLVPSEKAEDDDEEEDDDKLELVLARSVESETDGRSLAVNLVVLEYMEDYLNSFFERIGRVYAKTKESISFGYLRIVTWLFNARVYVNRQLRKLIAKILETLAIIGIDFQVEIESLRDEVVGSETFVKAVNQVFEQSDVNNNGELEIGEFFCAVLLLYHYLNRIPLSGRKRPPKRKYIFALYYKYISLQLQALQMINEENGNDAPAKLPSASSSPVDTKSGSNGKKGSVFTGLFTYHNPKEKEAEIGKAMEKDGALALIKLSKVKSKSQSLMALQELKRSRRTFASRMGDELARPETYIIPILFVTLYEISSLILFFNGNKSGIIMQLNNEMMINSVKKVIALMFITGSLLIAKIQVQILNERRNDENELKVARLADLKQREAEYDALVSDDAANDELEGSVTDLNLNNRSKKGTSKSKLAGPDNKLPTLRKRADTAMQEKFIIEQVTRYAMKKETFIYLCQRHFSHLVVTESWRLLVNALAVPLAAWQIKTLSDLGLAFLHGQMIRANIISAKVPKFAIPFSLITAISMAGFTLLIEPVATSIMWSRVERSIENEIMDALFREEEIRKATRERAREKKMKRERKMDPSTLQNNTGMKYVTELFTNFFNTHDQRSMQANSSLDPRHRRLSDGESTVVSKPVREQTRFKKLQRPLTRKEAKQIESDNQFFGLLELKALLQEKNEELGPKSKTEKKKLKKDQRASIARKEIRKIVGLVSKRSSSAQSVGSQNSFKNGPFSDFPPKQLLDRSTTVSKKDL